MEQPRSTEQRLVDTMAKLEQAGGDVWVATSSRDGEPYLVPLSLSWMDERIVLALEYTSRTARNLEATRTARLGVGPTRDVVLMDAEVERIEVAGESALLTRYAAQADWTPPGDYALVTLRPTRVQAWREANEIAGRTLMRSGAWVRPE
jgi:nitroimidazol reductase NimA-like FMN-containing flavoprotein (pyridoxamine 5'-phosphate oxidase superfamily)